MLDRSHPWQKFNLNTGTGKALNCLRYGLGRDKGNEAMEERKPVARAHGKKNPLGSLNKCKRREDRKQQLLELLKMSS